MCSRAKKKLWIVFFHRCLKYVILYMGWESNFWLCITLLCINSLKPVKSTLLLNEVLVLLKYFSSAINSLNLLSCHKKFYGSLLSCRKRNGLIKKPIIFSRVKRRLLTKVHSTFSQKTKCHSKRVHHHQPVPSTMSNSFLVRIQEQKNDEIEKLF